VLDAFVGNVAIFSKFNLRKQWTMLCQVIDGFVCKILAVIKANIGQLLSMLSKMLDGVISNLRAIAKKYFGSLLFLQQHTQLLPMREGADAPLDLSQGWTLCLGCCCLSTLST